MKKLKQNCNNVKMESKNGANKSRLRHWRKFQTDRSPWQQSFNGSYTKIVSSMETKRKLRLLPTSNEDNQQTKRGQDRNQNQELTTQVPKKVSKS